MRGRVVFEGSAGDITLTRTLTKVAHFLFRHAGMRGAVLTVLLRGPALRAIKRRAGLTTRNGEPIDVLAFPEPAEYFPHPESRLRPLGTIYLNAAIHRHPRYARLGWTRETVLAFLFIHGFLHLMGFRHSKKGDMLKMQKREGELMHALRKARILT